MSWRFGPQLCAGLVHRIHLPTDIPFSRTNWLTRWSWVFTGSQPVAPIAMLQESKDSMEGTKWTFVTLAWVPLFVLGGGIDFPCCFGERRDSFFRLVISTQKRIQYSWSNRVDVAGCSFSKQRFISRARFSKMLFESWYPALGNSISFKATDSSTTNSVVYCQGIKFSQNQDCSSYSF